jgi:predicted O-linked N-acetylglucosamine transferase (SPINDLY family)
MDLLRDFPGSVLWLIKLNQDSEANLRKEALRRDIDPNRIIFAERLPSVEAYLARYDHVDVYLDTFPYNAHSTATDLARMGVPVVTAVGRSFASRVCAGVMSGYGSILSNDPVPYQEAIQSATDTGRNTTDRDHEAHVLAQYKDRARQFAQSAHDTQHLRIQTKNRLAVTSGSRRGNVKALSGLTAKHSRSLEDLYQQMYSMRLSNEL